jgi:hypothetical protein
MVSLTMLARLVKALGEDARLILIGDPDQLSSIEAGAVLRDIASPARPDGNRAATAIADSVIVLDRVHPFGKGIARSPMRCAAATPMARSLHCVRLAARSPGSPRTATRSVPTPHSRRCSVRRLPPHAPSSPPRELLYTAVTRARRHLIVVGTEEAVCAAVARPAARASGLRERLRDVQVRD